MENNFNSPQAALPNASAILVLGIISIVTCWCYGISGLVCAIIALVLSGKAKKLYNADPENYLASSYKNVNAGRICAIIGIILSALFIVYLVVFFVIYGYNSEMLQELLQQYQK